MTMQKQIEANKEVAQKAHVRADFIETRLANVEARLASPPKPWFLMKGVMGPLASGAATIALVIGYIQNWDANAMAIIASVAGGGSVTGIIGRLAREGKAADEKVPQPRAGRPGLPIASVLTLVAAALLLPAPPVQAWSWRGDDTIVDCYEGPDGAMVQMTREICKETIKSRRIDSAMTQYETLASKLEMLKPPENCTGSTNEGYCEFAKYVFNEQVMELREEVSAPMEFVDREAQRAHQDKLDKRHVVRDYVEMALGLYSLDKRVPAPGGDTFIAGDNFDVNGRAGGGSGGAEGSGGGGSGVSIQKTGDNALVWNKSGRMQATLASPSSIQDQDNRQDQAGTEFQPAAAEGSSATFSPQGSDNRDQSTLGIGL